MGACAVCAEAALRSRRHCGHQTGGLPRESLSKILSKIFPSDHPAVAQNAPSAATTHATTSTQGTGTGTGPAASSKPAPSAAANASPVDVEAVLNELAQKNSEKLNWRTSIVESDEAGWHGQRLERA